MPRRGLIALLGGLIAVVVLVLSMWSRNPKIDQVVVRDMSHADSLPIRTIDSGEDLNAFQTIWSSREKLPPETAVQVQYKFELLSSGQGDVWLYDPAGLMRVLTKAKTPVYRVPSAEAFNRLLGVDRRATPQ